VEHGLGVVARRVERKVRDDALHLLAQHGDLVRAAVVRRGRPQPQESMLAGDLAARAEGLHADVVQVGAAMNRGRRVGLGENQQLARTRVIPNFASQRGGGGFATPAALADRATRRAKNSEPGAHVGHEPVALLAADEPVVAVAEKPIGASIHSSSACVSSIVGGRRWAVSRLRQWAHPFARASVFNGQAHV
jgi:hypothetical protein